MRILIDHDEHIRSTAARSEEIEAVVRGALDHFGERVTFVQVHLSDENGPRFGTDDKRCLMEARIAHREPIAVSHRATDVHQAVSGAATKLERSLTSALGRMRSH